MQRFQDNYYSGLAQATQIALINAIAEGGEYDSYESVYLPDSAEWYESIQIYPNQMLEDPYAQYYSEANDRRWNEMVDEQYEEE